MQKLNEKKILGTVPKKLQLVETFWDCPEFSRNKQNQTGITLIALIITIIVMLILVGVTINVALNGGLFEKAEEATTKTKISQIQEALAIKEGEILADNEGVVEEYTLTLADLELPEKIKNEFSGKLIIGTDGKLYYDESVVTDTAEQNLFKSMGIQPYVEEPVPTRVPFTNYIEDGNYYYIKGDKASSSYVVAVFSKNPSSFTLYTIENGKKVEKPRIANIDRIIDKNEVKSELGYEKELLEQAMDATFEEISDDLIIFQSVGVIAFKSNYSTANIMNELYTLDTTYQFPS